VRGASGDVLLAAYVTADGTRSLDATALREALQRTLPSYMLPARIVLLDALPTTRTGKIDRQALPDPFAGPTLQHVAPRTETEAAVAQIWADVLGVERVGAHSNFIDLGGDSITAMRVADGLEARFGARITFGRILAATTLAGVAGVVDELTRR